MFRLILIRRISILKTAAPFFVCAFLIVQFKRVPSTSSPVQSMCFVLFCFSPYFKMISFVIFYSQGNTMKLLWTYADKDPVYGHLKWHGVFSGVRPIHMLAPLWKKPNPSHNLNNRDMRQWDVTVKNVSRTFSPYF